ncbi:MAG: type II toxin-antitoxin system RelE/ParE family toxin [Proteobacteria bacterium]|nr:type II toxin-antitoxin system RelE/ParE family toxin [Pseudomonadota bacterium]
MIKSFKDKETENIYNQNRSKKFPNEIQSRALKKLIMIDNALSEDDLRVPPANNYEHLKGARKGECSIRINDQWRICFLFENSDAYEVGIEDYH